MTSLYLFLILWTVLGLACGYTYTNRRVTSTTPDTEVRLVVVACGPGVWAIFALFAIIDTISAVYRRLFA